MRLFEALVMIIFNLGSIPFLFLLFFAYFTKTLKFKLNNKMFICMLINSFILVLAESIQVLYFAYSDNQLGMSIMLKLPWFFGALWGYLLLLYCIAFVKKKEFSDKFRDFKKSKLFRYITIFSIVFLIIFIILPTGTQSFEDFSFAIGLIPFFVVGYFFILWVSTYILVFRSKNKVSKSDKIAFSFIFLVPLFIEIIQVFLSRISLYCVANIIQLYLLYYFFENPDLYTISEIEQSKRATDNASRYRSEFLSNLSNEIRTPMTNIVGFCESVLCLDNYDEDMITDDVNIINSTGRSLLDIINNILDFSKIEGDSELLEEKEYQLKNVLVNLSNFVSSRLGKKDISFVMNIDQSIPNKLYGDQTKLYQVLLNILSNSVKYTEVGKITFNLSKELQGPKVLLKFRITDTGCGIKEEDFGKLFEKFSRLSETEYSEIDGTGLGLVIIKKYVDLMGGKIWFESEYGAGTSFFVEISQAIADSAPLGEFSIEENDIEKKELLDCSKYKVLIVDDDELNLNVASRILSRYKFQIDTCTNAQDCIYRVKSEENYDMIFIDPIMPVMDGVQLLHVLKKLNDYDIPPIVALTANAYSTARNYYLGEGFDEYLSKPVNFVELDSIINKYFLNK